MKKQDVLVNSESKAVRPWSRAVSSKALLILTSTVLFVTGLSSRALALGDDSGYEEVTYESLLNELSRKRARINTGPDPFAQLKIRAHMGMVNALSSLTLPKGSKYTYHNGLQMGFGIDLFSEYWYAEGNFRNFGTVKRITETYALREFDLRIVFNNRTSSIWGYKLGGGISARYFKFSDLASGYSTYDSTPATMGLFGIDARLSKSMSLGLEFTGRTALVAETIDRSGLDMALRLDTFF
jgi:hypothetical protein